MEIVKELNLNGNPQVVPNGSLVYAKNLKLSIDGTYITNDDGFSTCFDHTADSETLRNNLKVSNIKGEKVDEIFTDIEEYTEIIDGVPTIIRRDYYNQKIAGNINCPNEIVFLVYKEYTDTNTSTQEVYGEGTQHNIYRAVEFKDSNKFALFLVPTGWHYDGGEIIGTYTYNVYGHLIIGIAEYDANIDKQLLTIDLNDSYGSDSLDKYSCAPNVPIANLTLNNKVKGKAMPHGLYYFYIRYEISDKLYTNWFPVGAPQYALSLDYKTLFNHTYATNDQGTNVQVTTGSFLANTNKDSYYNLSYTITFNDTFSYIGFQIAYILQTDDTVVGRLWNNFVFNGNELSKSFLFNGDYIEEISIEDLTRDVLNIYNVKALTNYNNKLYAANFKETDYNVDLKGYADEIDTFLVKKVVDIEDIEKASTNMVTWTYRIKDASASITVTADTSSVRLKDFPNLLAILNSKIEWQNPNEADVLTCFGEEARVNFYEHKLSFSPSLPDPYYSGDIQYKRFWTKNTLYCFGSFWGGGFTGGGLEPSGLLHFGQADVTKTEVTVNYNSYNTDNIIRTLMPYEVYAFYVHYVRPDGSYTNGIPLENKIHIDSEDKLCKQIKDLDASDLQTYHLTDISTIDEIKDKYLYELYIRQTAYAKEYFKLYLDNKGKRLFRTNSGILHRGNDVYLLRLGVRFEHIIYPPGYVGAFFSYEKINALSVYQGYVSDNLSSNNNILIKANDCEAANIRYDGTLFIPHHKIGDNGIESISNEPYYSYINNAAPVLANASINFEGAQLSRAGLHGGIAMNLSRDNNNIYQPSVGIVGSVILFNRSIYANETKELIPFGPVSVKPLDYNGTTVFGTYGENSDALAEVDAIDVTDTNINYDINYPSFLIQDKVLTYKDSIFINEQGSVNLISDNIIKTDNYYQQSNYIKRTYVWKFSNVNLLALEIKKEPEDIGGVVNNNYNTVNTVVKPINASDLFKLESCYIPQIHKAYTNYNKYLTTSNVFTNIVRCSYSIRNESGINSWRIFDPTKYYIIDNSNGEIVNIFGAGSSFFVHTKNNLLVTSSDGKITADNSIIHLQENNIFDIPPVEIFTSDLGYGGIKYQNCQLFSQFGYIWYDTDRRKLFRWDSGQLIDINSGISELIKKYQFEYCYINIDNNSNRIFFCFKKDNSDRVITVAYNTLSNKWLSLYDFAYDMTIHTANVVLFGSKSGYYIYSYDATSDPCNYDLLEYENPDLPDYAGGSVTDKPYFCFDVIFNSGYTIPKVLNNITWVHELIKNHTLDKNHPAQLKLEYNNISSRVHDVDGLQLIIYSDSVDSGILDLEHNTLNDVANVDNPDAYKYPYYDKGVWHLSYFRNAIGIPVTDTEANALIVEYGQDTIDNLEDVYKAIDRNGNPIYYPSDMKSLIYGKYLCIRFIFKTDKRIKFDNVEFNLEKY